MIRWQYVVTRLLIVVVVVLLVSWGLSPVVKYVTVQGLQQATGAKVEIGDTHVGLFPPRVQYSLFRVADPRDGKEMRDAFRADSIELSLDGDALLQRRWVARTGRISGLQIGATRSESGHFDNEEEELAPTPPDASRGSSALSRLLTGMAGQLESQAGKAVQDLQTVQQSNAIKKRWKTEYDSLVARAKKLETQVKTFRDQVRGIENPLRDWENLDRTFAVASEARAELKAVRDAIDALPEKMQADLVALDRARQTDLERVDRLVPGDLSESESFGLDLISSSVRERVGAVREYWESGRTLANYTVVAPENVRGRGVDIDLLGKSRRPEILLRQCEVEGLLRADGEAYSLTGIVENMTPSPELLDEPLRARLELDGPQKVRVEYVRDRRDAADVDLLTLHWPASDAGQLVLGNDQDVTVSVNGGQREVWVQLRSEGDQIQGRFVSKQTDVQLALNMDPKFAKLPAAESLRRSLSQVNTVEIDAGFTGTWDMMKMDMNTNLGQVLRQATREAVASQMADAKRVMSERVNRVYQEQADQLRRQFTQQQGEARSLVAGTDQLVQELSEKVLGEVDSAEVTVGRMRQFFESKLR